MHRIGANNRIRSIDEMICPQQDSDFAGHQNGVNYGKQAQHPTPMSGSTKHDDSPPWQALRQTDRHGPTQSACSQPRDVKQFKTEASGHAHGAAGSGQVNHIKAGGDVGSLAQHDAG